MLRICTLLLLLLLWGCKRENVVDGVFEIDSDEINGGSTSLSGNWEMYPRQIIAPGAFSIISPKYMRLPGTWSNTEYSDSLLHCATFRCQMIFKSNRPDSLSFSCMEQLESYRFFVNGELVLQDGVPSEKASTAQPSAQYQRNVYHLQSDTLTCVLQVSSYKYPAQAGPIYPVIVGTPKTMALQFMRTQVLYAILLGVLLILGIQHLISFVIFPREKGFLYFGLYCLSWFILGVFDTNYFRFSTLLIPDISFELLYRVYNVVLPASILVTVLFIDAVFPSKILRFIQKPFSLFCVIPIIAGVILSLKIQSHIMPTFLILVLPVLGGLFTSVVEGVRQKKRGAGVLLCGLVLYAVAAVNDALVFSGVISNGYIMLVGVTGFILSQAYVLALRHGDTYQRHTILLDEVTEKNSELSRLSKIKDEFLATTSHELRTPLHGIIGISESLLDKREELSGFVYANISLIEMSVRRLVNLVNSILDFSKMRNNDLHIQMECVDLMQVVDIVIPHFMYAAEKKGIKIEREFCDQNQLIVADHERLVQVLFNLIGNAIKFTDSGSIKIRTSISEKTLLLEIVDTGIGISEDDIETIFEPFKQSTSGKQGYHRGTGLGLSITKNLVELQGGAISVDSTLGRGSVFTVSFQLADTKSCVATSKEIPRYLYQEHDFKEEELPSESAVKQAMVLAIDDEPTNLQIIKNHLTNNGISLVTAETGTHALSLIKKYAPAVILLDIMMPGKNGYDVCKEIREHYTPSDMPIVFISAKNRIEDLVLGFEVGGNDYILKPFLKQELLARISLHIKQREAFLILKENLELKSNLADAILEKEQLLTSQKQLIALLHTLPESIILVDSDDEIVFINVQFSAYFNEELEGRPIAEIMHLDNATGQGVIVAPTSDATFQNQVLHRSIEMDGESLRIITLLNEKTSAQYSNRIFDEITRSEKRITEIDSLFEEEGRSHELLTTVHLQERDAITEAVELMELVVSIWELTTHKTRVDFAEASGLWKVNRDRDGWARAVTLNKYLSVSKIPRFPKWNKIFASAQWLLDNCNPKGKLLESKVHELEKRFVSLQKLRMR